MKAEEGATSNILTDHLRYEISAYQRPYSSEKEVDTEYELMSKVPDNGEPIGNITLMKRLSWQPEDYWKIRNRLIERGMLDLGKGKGGSVKRPIKVVNIPDQAVAAEPRVEAAPRDDYQKEVALYPKIAKMLSDSWVAASLYDESVVQITAQQGSKLTGGKWSRPDIAVAVFSTYPYVPGRHFDVVTFEVKAPEGIDITVVYEALAHRRSATRSYVLLHVPLNFDAEPELGLDEVYAEAKKYGIGVITFGKVDEYETWEEVVEPVRVEPDPRRLNDFLAKQFTIKQLEQIMKWFK